MRSTKASGDCSQSVAAEPGNGPPAEPREVRHPEVAGERRGDLVRDPVHGHGGREARGPGDEPLGEEAAVRQAEHPEPAGVGAPVGHGPVDDREAVLGVGPAPAALQRGDPGAAVALGAARVGAQHPDAGGGQGDRREPRQRRVRPGRAAVDLEHRRQPLARPGRPGS